jgi:predicted GNAT family acetyltransferase
MTTSSRYKELLIELTNECSHILNKSYITEDDSVIKFELNEHMISITTSVVEKSEPNFISNLLKTFIKPNDNFSLPSKEQIRPYFNEGTQEAQSGERDTEKNNNRLDESMVKHIKMRLNEISPVYESSTTELSKLKSQYLRNIMNQFSITPENNTDKSEINKQNEVLFLRSIVFEGEPVGEIKYLEDETSVTIIRSDVDAKHQGKGLATKAYKTLIDEKMKAGKVIHSDNILSDPAQAIYRKLEEEGYTVSKQPSRLKYRGVTSLTAKNLQAQHASFPTVYRDGARVTESGFRMQGTPVFKVTKSPNLDIDISPVDIVVEGKNTKEKVTFSISPHNVIVSEVTGARIEDTHPNLFVDINEILNLRGIGVNIERDHIEMRKEQVIESKDLDLAIRRKAENSHQLER